MRRSHSRKRNEKPIKDLRVLSGRLQLESKGNGDIFFFLSLLLFNLSSMLIDDNNDNNRTGMKIMAG